jgi:hypothetical protein
MIEPPKASSSEADDATAKPEMPEEFDSPLMQVNLSLSLSLSLSVCVSLAFTFPFCCYSKK